MSILAGIVVYHPDYHLLRDNIDAIRSQVDEVALFDNGSINLKEECPDVTILDKQGKNVGIASALNALCQYAKNKGHEWVLTLDQDSIAPKGMVEAYRPYMSGSETALLCPRIKDRNYGSLDNGTGQVDGVAKVEFCITSGSLLRLSAWEKVHGFWDDLFIDMVDFDFCWSLQEAGFSIFRVYGTTLDHEIGRGKRVRLFGKDNVVFNHSPQRCYYMIRNSIIVGRKHHREKLCARWSIKRILLINLYEKNRWAKDRMIAKGIIDGLKFGI